MGLQAAIVGWWLWVEYDRAQESGELPNWGLAFAMGLFFAFLITAGLFVAGEKLRWLWSLGRRRFIDRDAERLPGSLKGQMGEARGQGSSLVTSQGRGNDLPETLRGFR